MRLINMRTEQGNMIGLKTDHGVVHVQDTLKKIGYEPIPQTMNDMIKLGLDALTKLEKQIKEHKQDHVYIEADHIVYAPCVDNPGKIICIGLNYRKHAEESNMPIPDYPILFSKFNNALAGHQEEVVVSKYTNQLDYEAELGLVIGKQAKEVSEEEALDYVFGYFVANDLSARDLQFRSGQWLLGKTGDGLLPVGPELVTKDEITDPNNLRITCTLNGEVRQDSNTKDMIFNCKEIISYVSKFMTLEPGDIIVTGTPEGVIMGYPEDERVWLKPGDEVTVSIEGLGSLTTPLVADESSNTRG